MQNALKDMGLTDSEIKVYLALLELGDSTRNDIIKKSGITGSKVYENLQKLHAKGLISIYTHNKVKHFKPTNPENLSYILEEKRERLTIIENEIETILPKLLSRFNASKDEQEVELLTGLKGINGWFREQIDRLKGGEYNYVIGGTRGNEEELTTAFFRKIHLMREQKQIKTKMLYNIKQKKNVLVHYSSKDFSHSSTRFIEHSTPVSINIYKNKTLIIIWGETPTAINITSESVAQSFIEYFELLWKISTR